MTTHTKPVTHGGDPEHRLAIVSAGLEAAAHELQLLVEQMRKVLEDAKGDTGPKGDKGDRGPQGVPGPKGDRGDST